jgi:hypothetical protein
MFTYNIEELNDSPLFQLRLLLGQTNPNGLLVLQDEELLYLLSLNQDSIHQTAMDALNSLISRALELVDKTTGTVTVP